MALLKLENGERQPDGHADLLEWFEVGTTFENDSHGKIEAAELPETTVLCRGGKETPNIAYRGDYALIFNGDTSLCVADRFAELYSTDPVDLAGRRSDPQTGET